MRIRDFEWDEENIEHIARHQVHPDEAEETCKNQPWINRGWNARYLVYGQTNAGRYLFIVIKNLGNGTIRVITARDMTETEKRFYHRKK